MCGIAGGISFGSGFFPSKEELEKFIEPLKYRGPDCTNMRQSQMDHIYLSLAHTRLSIIDLSKAGNQPMKSVSENTQIVFNGEIYNYQLLRAELNSEGYKFNSNSDTEVLLNGFECWGMEVLLNKLDGMFAFALFSLKERKLFLVRDRFGKKPLYYYLDSANQRLAFSSDIRSFNFIDLNKTLDHHALGYFFSEMSTPGYNTIWSEIKKVSESEYMVYDGRELSIEKYWTLDYITQIGCSRKELIDTADHLLTKAIEKRLVADVNVSAMLSGGVDSSMVVAIMAKMSKDKISTYSVGFEEALFNELPYSRKVAEMYGTDHHEIMVKAKDFLVIDDIIDEFGEPFADPSMLPTYIVSKAISQYEKVTLSGDGGDEIFGGYYEYYLVHKLAKIKGLGFLFPLIRAVNRYYKGYYINLLVKLLSLSKLPEYSLLNRNYLFDKIELQSLFSEDVLINAIDTEHEQVFREYSDNIDSLLKKVLCSSLHTRLVNDYLVKVDRASMYASLEVRTPFLDKDLAVFSSHLSENQIFKSNEPKSILKELACRYLPHDFIYRKKMGFGVPLDDWFKNELKDQVYDVILGGKQNGIMINYTFVEELLGDYFNNGNVDVRKIWTLYVFHKWSHINGLF